MITSQSTRLSTGTDPYYKLLERLAVDKDKRECAFCKKEFSVLETHPYKIYCSKDCNNAMVRQRRSQQRIDKEEERKAALPEQFCVMCGKKYQPRSQNHYTCSFDCSEKRSRIKTNERKAKLRGAKNATH